MFGRISVQRDLKPNEIAIRVSLREHEGKFSATAHCSVEKFTPANVDISEHVPTIIGWLLAAYPGLELAAPAAASAAASTAIAPATKEPGEVKQWAEKIADADRGELDVSSLASFVQEAARLVPSVVGEIVAGVAYELGMAVSEELDNMIPPDAPPVPAEAVELKSIGEDVLELEQIGERLTSDEIVENAESLKAELEQFIERCRFATLTEKLADMYAIAQEKLRVMSTPTEPPAPPAGDEHADIPFGS
jgi:hypothetical protein